MKFILFLCLVACGDSPSAVLKHQGRPAPIVCANTGSHQYTCTDGLGVVWTCGKFGGSDATCIATGQISPEVPR